jgi:alkylation response protein AidB-like acyl-CoA dehydrogenase
MTQAALALDTRNETEDLCERVRAVAKAKLAPFIDAIDKGELYPAEALRAFGAEGAFASHMPQNGSADLRPAIAAMSVIGETCGATAFMTWCQDTLAWYVGNSQNAELQAKWLLPVSGGTQLGGTGLSNPMKTFFGIETMKLKGRKVEGGYIVKGALPWVSNLAPGHVFGTIFEREDAQDSNGNGERVMFLADCGDPAITLQACPPFLAMDGTGTYAVQIRNAFVPDRMILAENAMPFVKRIRAGFVLLQTGMGLGVMRDCSRGGRARGDDARGDALRSQSRLLAAGHQHPPEARRGFGRDRACRDAACRGPRLSQIASCAAPAARSLFRRHRHAGDQATEKNARRWRAINQVRTPGTIAEQNINGGSS